MSGTGRSVVNMIDLAVRHGVGWAYRRRPSMSYSRKAARSDHPRGMPIHPGAAGPARSATSSSGPSERPRAGLEGLPSRLAPPAASPEQRLLAKRVYDRMRLYHGTNSASADDIEKFGFQIGRKAGGATTNVGGPNEKMKEQSRVSHYLTDKKTVASCFASWASTGAGRGEPRLVRTLGVRSLPGAGVDRYHLEAVRVTTDIPASHVLPAGRPLSPEQLRLFRQALAQEAGVVVSGTEAAALFDDARSDTEGD